MIIQLRVKPGSKVEYLGFEGNVLVLKIKEKPKEGRANRALIEKLAEFFGIAKGCIEIVGGARSKMKKVKVDCISDNEILMRLEGARNADL